MDQIRADALENFFQRAQFTEQEQCAQILDQGSPRWKPCSDSELIQKTKRRLASDESIVILIPRAINLPLFRFKQQTFHNLFNILGLDHATLRPLSSIETSFCRTSGTQSASFYIRTAYDILVWKFDTASRTSRAFLFVGVSTGKEHGASVLGPRIETNVHLLKQPLGLLWLSFTSGLNYTKLLNDGSWEVLDAVERGTGYGKRERGQDEDSDRLTQWSKDVARTSVGLIAAEGICNILCTAYQEIARRDDSGAPLFEDEDALLVSKALLDHEVTKIGSLSERAKIQMNALFNLLTRADTKASVELTKTSKRLTEANLAVARAAKEDSGAMKTVSIMTMLFLPATYFAALFSMPTLRWGESPVVRKHFWVYWAFTLPTTICVFIVWAIATYLRSAAAHSRLDASRPKYRPRIFGKQRLGAGTSLGVSDLDIS